MQEKTKQRVVTGVGIFIVCGLASGIAVDSYEFFQDRSAKQAFNEAGYQTTGKKIVYTAQRDGETFEGVYEKGVLHIRTAAPNTP